jgi:predicted transcriptional regulator
VIFAIYNGSIVEIEEERENTAWINDDGDPAVVNKSELVPISDGMIDDLLQEFKSIKVKITDLQERMHRLDSEYSKKMEALREMYLDVRSKELQLVNRILKNSQNNCQK